MSMFLISFYFDMFYLSFIDMMVYFILFLLYLYTSMGMCRPGPLHLCITTHHFTMVPLPF